MVFELFDPDCDVRITVGSNLPHWYQPGVTYFITFRTEDSIPTDVAKQWYRRWDDWLRRHRVNPAEPNWKEFFAKLPRDAQREYHETFSREFLEYLDRGYGSCALKRPEMSQIVGDSLRHFDGDVIIWVTSS